MKHIPNRSSIAANAFILMLVLVLGGFGLYEFVVPQFVVDAQVNLRDYEEQIATIDQSIQRFQAVELDAAYLSTPSFRALRDFRVQLDRPRDIGRENPFDPLPPVDIDEIQVLPERSVPLRAGETGPDETETPIVNDEDLLREFF